MLTPEQLRQLIRRGPDKALARMGLAYLHGKGINLSEQEVVDIIELDDAMSQRLFSSWEEMTQHPAAGEGEKDT